jgi:integrase
MGRIRKGREVERDGRWYARIRWTDENGKERDLWIPAKNKSDASGIVEEKLHELKMNGEQSLDTVNMTFAEFADDFQKTYLIPAEINNGIKTAGRRSLTGIDAQVNVLRAFFGKRKLRQIRYSHIRAFRAERLKTPVVRIKVVRKKRSDVGKKVRVERPRSLASVHRDLQLLRRMLNVALREGIIPKNPFNCGDPLISAAAENSRERVLGHDEEERLLDACMTPDDQGRKRREHLRPILVCALETAMRAGEIMKLTWGDVDLKAGIITVRAANCKTEKRRIVPVTERLRVELEALWRTSPQTPDWSVFGVEDTVKKSFASACRFAKVDGFRFHDCRHTAITRMIAAGIPAPEVMKISGHTQMSTFLRYLNPTVETMNRHAETLTAYNMRRNAPVQAPEMVN